MTGEIHVKYTEQNCYNKKSKKRSLTSCQLFFDNKKANSVARGYNSMEKVHVHCISNNKLKI